MDCWVIIVFLATILLAFVSIIRLARGKNVVDNILNLIIAVFFAVSFPNYYYKSLGAPAQFLQLKPEVKLIFMGYGPGRTALVSKDGEVRYVDNFPAAKLRAGDEFFLEKDGKTLKISLVVPAK